MEIVCLDLEGVLVPEIWIAFAKESGIPELSRTTRDEPDYRKLMNWRMDVLREHNLNLDDIQNVIAKIRPLDGACDFLEKVRSITQVVILSDTFEEFARPLMKQLFWPTILCNSLKVDENRMLTDIVMRQEDGKRKAIESFRNMGFRTFAAGDSYNDLTMIKKADKGCLFRAPENILKEEPELKLCTTYEQFFEQIKLFVEDR